MGRKEEYKEKNLQYLQVLSTQEGICPLPCNMFYKVLQTGTGTVSPTIRSIVTVHYRGSLINGKEFDNSYDRNCPEAFRLCDVIEGWQLALQRMHVGDKWVVYIPYTMGYGNRTSGPIPAFSTLNQKNLNLLSGIFLIFYKDFTDSSRFYAHSIASASETPPDFRVFPCSPDEKTDSSDCSRCRCPSSTDAPLKSLC